MVLAHAREVVSYRYYSAIACIVAAVLHAAQEGDFDRKAAELFTKKYAFHAWNETDHTIDGEDWSLPLFCPAGVVVVKKESKG